MEVDRRKDGRRLSNRKRIENEMRMNRVRSKILFTRLLTGNALFSVAMWVLGVSSAFHAGKRRGIIMRSDIAKEREIEIADVYPQIFSSKMKTRDWINRKNRMLDRWACTILTCRRKHIARKSLKTLMPCLRASWFVLSSELQWNLAVSRTILAYTVRELDPADLP